MKKDRRARQTSRCATERGQQRSYSCVAKRHEKHYSDNRHGSTGRSRKTSARERAGKRCNVYIGRGCGYGGRGFDPGAPLAKEKPRTRAPPGRQRTSLRESRG
ncbi:hypothetical protein TRVL_06928 [Trypanosoma vivax]|nr:hypothetical protein TRVL_06928 [Trypanosoma vivax]